MLPHENENRAEIQRSFGDEFARSQCLIDGCIAFLDRLRDADMPFADEAKAFILGTYVREVRRYRSIIAECELGLLENAFALMRAMYEGMLSLRYVLNQTVSAKEQSEGLQSTLSKLPALAQDMPVQEFRTQLYHAMDALTVLQLASSLNESDSAATNKFKQLVDRIPEAWRKVHQQHPRTYSGITVAQLAEYCGMARLHRELYYQQCHVTHANDAMRFVRPDGEGNAWILLSSSIVRLPETLRLAASLLFRIVETLESGLGLDADMETIFNEYRHTT